MNKILRSALSLLAPVLLAPAILHTPSSLAAALPEGSATGNLVTPHIEAAIEPGRNLVFCSAFQIAWTGMCEDIIGGQVMLDAQLKTVDILNRALCGTGDLRGFDYLAMAGYCGSGIVERINNSLRKRFGAGAPVLEKIPDCDDSIVSYAFISKRAGFARPFQVFSGPLQFIDRQGGRVEVEGFGIEGETEGNEDLRSQVEIIEYGRYGEAIIRLASKDPGDEIVLAMVEPRETLLETIENVRWRIAMSERCGGTEKMAPTDILRIPKVRIAESVSFEELLGRHLLNPGFTRYFIARASEEIRFGLDQDGAGLETEAVFVIKKGGFLRRMISFTRPFLLYMKRKDGRSPYLAIWVENAEALVRL